jgi:hypothetical protein
MDALVIGGLTAVTAVVGVFWWQLLVQPDALLAGWARDAEEQQWFEHHPALLAALRWVAGSLVFVLGFGTGLALTFLARTG